MIARRALTAIAGLACTLSACDGSGTPGPAPSQSAAPSATATVMMTTHADGGGSCSQRSQDFRYVDSRTGATLPYMAYKPQIALTTNFWEALPPSPQPGATDIGYVVGQASGSAQGPIFTATLTVPQIDFGIVYGPHDRGTAILLPSGPLSNDYLKDVLYRHGLAVAGLAAATAALDATPPPADATPAPPPSPPAPDPSAAWDKWFQTNEEPAIHAVQRGIDGDDGFESPTPWMYRLNHVRGFECNWLQNKYYDAYVTITHNVPAPASQAQTTMESQLSSYHASSDQIGSTKWVPQSYQTMVWQHMQPAFIPPIIVEDADKYERNPYRGARPWAGRTLFTMPAPNPNDTAAP